MYKAIGLSSLFTLFSFGAQADRYCVKDVDNVQLFYINGMFTDELDFNKNLKSLDSFQHSYLNQYDIESEIEGYHNYNEAKFYQITEVAFHKLTDEEKNGDKGRVVDAALRGALKELTDDMVEALAWFYSVIYEDVGSIVEETDYQNMKVRLTRNLDKCARTILVTHSQGNFYGNRLYTDVINSYSYPNGNQLIEYPMLGYIGIANPTFSYGGAFGVNNPEIAKTFTNSNDIVMTAVRLSLGAITPAPVRASAVIDNTGHGLKDSYLQDHAAPHIARMMKEIVDNLTPYPVFDQYPSSSSATSHIGYSVVSEILDIRFRYGGGYRYEGVNPQTWRRFYNST